MQLFGRSKGTTFLIYGGVDLDSSFHLQEAPAFLFFNPQSSWDPMVRFLFQILACLQFQNMKQSVGMAIRRKFYIQVPIRFFDSIFEIFVYLFMYVVLIFMCSCWVCLADTVCFCVLLVVCFRLSCYFTPFSFSIAFPCSECFDGGDRKIVTGHIARMRVYVCV